MSAYSLIPRCTYPRNKISFTNKPPFTSYTNLSDSKRDFPTAINYAYIPYSWKYWRSLNLAVWPQTKGKKILAEFKFGGGALQRITNIAHAFIRERSFILSTLRRQCHYYYSFLIFMLHCTIIHSVNNQSLNAYKRLIRGN